MGIMDRETMDRIDDLQHALVDERIAALRRDAAGLHAERKNQELTEATDTAVGSRLRAVGPSPARVRVGHWLIGLGNAIAGSPEGRGDAAGRAA
jgi:hypothetical protein